MPLSKESPGRKKRSTLRRCGVGKGGKRSGRKGRVGTYQGLPGTPTMVRRTHGNHFESNGGFSSNEKVLKGKLIERKKMEIRGRRGKGDGHYGVVRDRLRRFYSAKSEHCKERVVSGEKALQDGVLLIRPCRIIYRKVRSAGKGGPRERPFSSLRTINNVNNDSPEMQSEPMREKRNAQKKD